MENQSELARENKELRSLLAEAEETLNAIRNGEVDALITAGPDGNQVYTLQGAETPYRILVEEMSQGALMLAPDGTILYANSRCAEMCKTQLEKIIGSTWEKFFSPVQYRQLQDCLKTPEPCLPPEELRLVAADGSSRPVHLSLRSMMTSGVPGFSVILTDLTERQQTEAVLRQSSERLRENNKKLEAFSFSISHDLRAPLRCMQGFGRILMEEYQAQLEPEPRSYLARIVAAADQLDRLISDVLSHSRLTCDESQVATFELVKMITEMVEAYPNLREANIEIISSSGRVRGHAVPLGQCILNLLSNALKFVPRGQVPLVKVWTEPANGFLRLWVQDNGIGILPEDQGRIFDVLTRIHGDEDFEGTGLGLSMVKVAVEKMGGRVGVQSELGQGSRFWIELQNADEAA